MNNKEIIQDDLVAREDLVNSFSKHAKLTNTYMLGILLCCITYAINLTPSEKLVFPFIGEIKYYYFHLISMILISCLIILFSSSHLMGLRIKEYYNKFYNSNKDKDYIDLTVEPTIFRMAPISWMIKNTNSFYINLSDAHHGWKKFELLIYFILKIFVIIITYLFPTIVLIVCIHKSGIYDFCKFQNVILRYFLICLTIVSIMSFCIVWKNEIVAMFRMPGKLFEKNK